MKGLSLLRALTPAGWLVLGVAGLVGLALVLGGLGFRWDPFELDRRRLHRAEAVAAGTRAEAAARSAEASGQAGQITRLETALRSSAALERATSLFLEDARNADDAPEPLPADRVDRLLDHDRELCRLSPDLKGCRAAPDLTGDGVQALRPASAP